MTADENPLGMVVAKARQDEAFKAQLIADPAATLAAEGVALPEGTTVNAVEDTESVRHLVLPSVAGALSDEAVTALSGGMCADVSMCQSKEDACRWKGPM